MGLIIKNQTQPCKLASKLLFCMYTKSHKMLHSSSSCPYLFLFFTLEYSWNRKGKARYSPPFLDKTTRTEI
ncbi:unnamed protein product [Linum tenue]|uniref:Uncharacterized protein n=1 Tax=Linum tenue TaxID=586396 RepID=A0AAV0MYI8_9ROSI|nr:unnamed protein product [Linum tenue]